MKEGRNYLSIALCSILFATTALYASETEKLDSVTVTDTTVSNYQTIDKTKIDRSNIEIEDSAKLVQVYTEDFLFDYQPQSLTDIVTMSSNTVFAGDDHGRNSNYIMRGFGHAPILRDGFNLSNAIANTEMYNFERVEVLKGPGSLQYGDSNPGGLINLVKKKPTKDAVANIELEVTTDPSVNPKVDLGGSLNEDGSLRYRLVSTYRHKEDNRDFNVDHERTFIAPSIAYDINDNNTLTFVTEYLDETTPADFGTIIIGDNKTLGDRDYVTTHPDQEFDKTQYIAGFDLESNYETWNSTFRYRYIDLSRDNDAVYSPGYNYNTNSLRKLFATQHFDSKEHTAQYTINKEFNILNMKNKISLGLDAKKSDVSILGYNGGLVSYTGYGPYTTKSDHPNGYDYIDQDSTIKSYGAFLQDHLYITDNLILSLGLRHQTIKTDYTTITHTAPNNAVTDTNGYDKTYNANTPQIGLVYKLSPQTTLFANYAETFYAQDPTYTTSTGELLEPEEGKGYEAGVKQKLFNDNFTLTTSIFRITKKNVALLDRKTTPFYTYFNAKKMLSKGLEIDLAGKITPFWSIIASYGYNETENYSNNKEQFAGVPKHTANIFTTYDLGDLGLNNFYVGAGARFIGKKYVYTDSTYGTKFRLDSATIYNAMVGYKKDNWRVNLTVKNLTDKDYLETSSSGSAAYGDKRTGILTVSYSF